MTLNLGVKYKTWYDTIRGNPLLLVPWLWEEAKAEWIPVRFQDFNFTLEGGGCMEQGLKLLLL